MQARPGGLRGQARAIAEAERVDAVVGAEVARLMKPARSRPQRPAEALVDFEQSPRHDVVANVRMERPDVGLGQREGDDQRRDDQCELERTRPQGGRRHAAQARDRRGAARRKVVNRNAVVTVKSRRTALSLNSDAEEPHAHRELLRHRRLVARPHGRPFDGGHDRARPASASSQARSRRRAGG